jgi:hypothetical protein
VVPDLPGGLDGVRVVHHDCERLGGRWDALDAERRLDVPFRVAVRLGYRVSILEGWARQAAVGHPRRSGTATEESFVPITRTPADRRVPRTLPPSRCTLP